jgi:hypothetical protein
VVLKVVGGALDVVLATLLVKKQAQLECRLGLWLPVERAVCDVEHFAKILNCHPWVPIFALALSKTFVGLAELLLVFVLNTDLQETVQILNRTWHFVLSLVNKSNLLIALGFFHRVVGASSHIKTLFEELKTQFCFTLFVVFYGDQLVDTDEVLRNLTSDLFQVALYCFVKGCL